MKITNDNQRTAPAGEIIDNNSAAQKAAPRSGTGGQAPRREDSVELSSALDAELRTQEIEQARRVEEIKSRLAAGEYRVAPRAVAEKILSGRSEE